MSLDELRCQIEGMDEALLRLLNERMGLSVEIGKLKQREGRAIYDPAREEKLLAALSEQNEGPMTDEALEAIYRAVLEASRAIQQSSVPGSGTTVD
tara:strand:- start:84 stop:371 length:288 start_codon:yes stop_codon:yes gene_type:complete